MTKLVFSQTFVAVAAIIEQKGKILLVQENKGPEKGKWNQPAGWLDLGLNPIGHIKTEVREETGLEFEPGALLGIYSLWRRDLEKVMHAKPHVIKLTFIGRVTGGKLIKSNQEIAAVKWFTLSEIDAMDGATLRDLDIKQEVRDYFAGQSYPLEIIRHTISE